MLVKLTDLCIEFLFDTLLILTMAAAAASSSSSSRSPGQACCGASVPGEGFPPLYRRRSQPASAGAEPGDGRSHQHPTAQSAQGRDRHHRGEGGCRPGAQPHPSHLR